MNTSSISFTESTSTATRMSGEAAASVRICFCSWCFYPAASCWMFGREAGLCKIFFKMDVVCLSQRTGKCAFSSFFIVCDAFTVKQTLQQPFSFSFFALGSDSLSIKSARLVSFRKVTAQTPVSCKCLFS